MQTANRLDRGVFTLSLDFELIWGTVDHGGPERFRQACEVEREAVIDRLLTLLAEFDISATWCIVGHLFLSSCVPVDGAKHPEIVRPSHSWSQGDWFVHDPCGSERTDPICHGASLIEKIRACPVPQEIGCHSFSHVIFGDAGCSRATAASELAECVSLARQQGIRLHLADVLSARRPPVVVPEETADGVWNIPGSMLYSRCTAGGATYRYRYACAGR